MSGRAKTVLLIALIAVNVVAACGVLLIARRRYVQPAAATPVAIECAPPAAPVELDTVPIVAAPVPCDVAPVRPRAPGVAPDGPCPGLTDAGAREWRLCEERRP